MTWTIGTNPKNHFHHLLFDEEVALDSSTRGLKISEIPVFSLGSPTELHKFQARLSASQLPREGIWIAHQLPHTKSKKDSLLNYFIEEVKSSDVYCIKHA